jgi:transposase
MFAMLSMEKRVEIDVLYRQGKGIREIARATGLARNTVCEIIRGQHDGDYGPRPQRQTMTKLRSIVACIDHPMTLREARSRTTAK